MIFDFLRYTNPVWFFNLKPKSDNGYFPFPESIPDSYSGLGVDNRYISIESQKRDIAWRAFHFGFINREEDFEGIDIWNDINIPLHDEYVFLRKYFNSRWIFYVLFLRTLKFNNVFKDLNAIWKTRRVKKVSLFPERFLYEDYDSYDSTLLRENPLVSIIIPTLNRYEYLKKVFYDLENQTYKNFEVIVVDQSTPFDQEVYSGLKLNIKFWHQNERALWKARNEAIKLAQGEFILLYDDDSRVDSDWIEQHLKSLDFFKSDLSSGVSISVVGAEIPKHYQFFRWSDQLDTGNVLIRKDVFYKIGLFDRQFEKQRMGDAEFGLRAYLNGFRNISNPRAKRLHLKVKDGGLREMGSWDALRPKGIFSPRPIPSVLYFFRKYFGNKVSIIDGFRMAFLSYIPYRYKSSKIRYVYLLITLIVLMPLVLYCFFHSWNLSSKLLKEGSKISILKF